jgi:predicted S18 family serine protease
MLTGGDASKGSAGYVAIEKFSGTVKGRKGALIFQHSATMTKGEGQLSITVVPDSGTDELAGISGKLTIKIENGKHFYDFEYSLK